MSCDFTIMDFEKKLQVDSTGENFKNHLTPRGAESSRIGHGNHWAKSVVTLFFNTST